VNWFADVFGVEKVAIASLYLPPLPGSPDFKAGTSLEQVIAQTRREVTTLHEGGMDGVVFGNQQDRPWRVGTGPETAALMTRIISDATRDVAVPFGITVFWDDLAAIAVAKATQAAFVRGIFRGTYAGEMGLLNLNAGEGLRYRNALDAEDIRLIFVLRPILCQSITPRELKSQVRDVLWGSKADALALGGPIPGKSPTPEELEMVKGLAGSVPVLMNNGATTENIDQVFSIVDGVVIGTHLREDSISWKSFEKERVQRFMEAARRNR
jgi:membrane complex biogenesis BtpA family protein